jgi:putative transposase
LRSRERFTKLLRLLKRDPRARVRRATVQRRGSKWYVSFTVVRSPKRRRARRPHAVVGVDVGLRHLATLSTGVRVENLRPLQVAHNHASLALAVAQAKGSRALFVAATGAETPNARGATDREAHGPDGRPPRTAKAPSTGHPAVDETAAVAA